jgi:hypothetical protein
MDLPSIGASIDAKLEELKTEHAKAVELLQANHAAETLKLQAELKENKTIVDSLSTDKGKINVKDISTEDFMRLRKTAEGRRRLGLGR